MYNVYFITQKIKGKKGLYPIKIGYSKDPDARLKALQTASPHKLRISILLPFETKREAEIVEHCFHNLGKAKHKSLSGEWFIIFGDRRNFIAQSLKMADVIIKKTKSLSQTNCDQRKRKLTEIIIKKIKSKENNSVHINEDSSAQDIINYIKSKDDQIINLKLRIDKLEIALKYNNLLQLYKSVYSYSLINNNQLTGDS